MLFLVKIQSLTAARGATITDQWIVAFPSHPFVSVELDRLGSECSYSLMAHGCRIQENRSESPSIRGTTVSSVHASWPRSWTCVWEWM